MIDLYVDDLRPAPDGWLIARTVADAKLQLTAGRVNALSLDHDMGACLSCVSAQKHIGDMKTPETQYMNWCSHAEDGTALVHWMIETGHWSRLKPTVHSMNPVGAARMRGMIERYWPGDAQEVR